ncbi:Acp5 [Symbiodinium natans]|uniref:Acp5 protein n=1 Tax=Symbiodinium natans TaxID=878477 RepID=A0A812NVM0_9DINO|nr:Acp5 [Symbiodinium natans]
MRAPSHQFEAAGDWGGILSGSEPVTFKNRPQIVDPIDTHAQSYVAGIMATVAAEKKPKFVVNVGDNFYPGGISSPGTCNAETDKTDSVGGVGVGFISAALMDYAGQIIFTNIFENVYKGPGLDGVEWWGVLGNHDYGGYHYNVHWDQNIFYTWSTPQSRWLTPALFWKRRAQFRNFSAEFFFVDTNKVDTYANPDVDAEHNICSRSHNQPPLPLGCNGTSITGPDTCWKFFDDLWKEQKDWLAQQLDISTADWQIIVTHYPPNFEPCRSEVWESYLAKYGVDFYISGHTHLQNTSTTFGGTPFVISGGGGGITSEILPSTTGEDDGYGFMDVVIRHDAMYVTRYSHGILAPRTVDSVGPHSYCWLVGNEGMRCSIQFLRGYI